MPTIWHVRQVSGRSPTASAGLFGTYSTAGDISTTVKAGLEAGLKDAQKILSHDPAFAASLISPAYSAAMLSTDGDRYLVARSNVRTMQLIAGKSSVKDLIREEQFKNRWPIIKVSAHDKGLRGVVLAIRNLVFDLRKTNLNYSFRELARRVEEGDERAMEVLLSGDYYVLLKDLRHSDPDVKEAIDRALNGEVKALTAIGTDPEVADVVYAICGSGTVKRGVNASFKEAVLAVNPFKFAGRRLTPNVASFIARQSRYALEHAEKLISLLPDEQVAMIADAGDPYAADRLLARFMLLGGNNIIELVRMSCVNKHSAWAMNAYQAMIASDELDEETKREMLLELSRIKSRNLSTSIEMQVKQAVAVDKIHRKIQQYIESNKGFLSADSMPMLDEIAVNADLSSAGVLLDAFFEDLKQEAEKVRAGLPPPPRRRSYSHIPTTGRAGRRGGGGGAFASVEESVIQGDGVNGRIDIPNADMSAVSEYIMAPPSEINAENLISASKGLIEVNPRTIKELQKVYSYNPRLRADIWQAVADMMGRPSHCKLISTWKMNGLDFADGSKPLYESKRAHPYRVFMQRRDSEAGFVIVGVKHRGGVKGWDNF